MKFSVIAVASLLAAKAYALNLDALIKELDNLLPDTASCLKPCTTLECVLDCVGDDTQALIHALGATLQL